MDADNHEKQMKLKAYGFGVIAGLYILCIRTPQVYLNSKDNADTLKEFSSSVDTSPQGEFSPQYKGVISSQLAGLRVLNLSEDNSACLESIVKDTRNYSFSLKEIKQKIDKINYEERITGLNTAIKYVYISGILTIISGLRFKRLKEENF